MPIAHIDTIERSVQKTNQWLQELVNELGTDGRTSWRVLRGYLQVLRDRLTIAEAAQLAAQLPHVLRGVFYEGFDPGHQPQKIRDPDVFLARFADHAQLREGDDPATAVAAVTRVLRRHVAGGEVDDVLSQLPLEIRNVLEPNRRPADQP